MHLRITGDANADSGILPIVLEISGSTRKHFLAQEYGAGLNRIGVILMCRNPNLNFKRRIQFAKKEKTLFMDVMLDLNKMRLLEHRARKKIILERLTEEIPAILRKYSFSDFEESRFVEDLKSWLKSIGE